ncbi:MAG: hypothetical protein EOO75_06400 [Myxococcales bacterium]|nr:MAG: hypothetical protein EOO75_06400 [Myxococcales bacterium]
MTFGYATFVNAPFDEPGSRLLLEPGLRSFYVDGHCQFWATSPMSDGYYPWQPIRTGTLTAAQAQQLAADAGYDQWPAGRGDYTDGTQFDAPFTYLFDRDGKTSCAVACRPDAPAFVASMMTTMRDWHTTLYAQGTPVTTPMRARSVELLLNDPPYTVLPWPLATQVEAIEYDPSVSEYLGDAPLITDPADLVKLRQLRSDVLALPLVPPGPAPRFAVRQVLDGEGNLAKMRYRVFFRDTLPFENEHGLIALP